MRIIVTMKRNGKVRFCETRKPTRETHALPKLGNELLVRDVRLLPALSYDSQIFQILEQFLVLSHWKNHGCTLATIIRDVLNRIAHGAKVSGNRCNLQLRCTNEKFAIARAAQRRIRVGNKFRLSPRDSSAAADLSRGELNSESFRPPRRVN